MWLEISVQCFCQALYQGYERMMQGRVWPKMMEEIKYFREMVPDVATNDVDQQG